MIIEHCLFILNSTFTDIGTKDRYINRKMYISITKEIMMNIISFIFRVSLI